MLIVFNDDQFINLDNVGHALVEGKTIGFYLNSGESRHIPFATEEHAKKAFDEITSPGINANSKWIYIQTGKTF